MARFDFEDELYEAEDALDNGGIYLKDPEKGLELLCRLLDKPVEKKQLLADKKAIQEEIFSALARLDLEHGMEYYQWLMQIGCRLKEQERLGFLDGKAVVGVGGAFSAGKSCFINSLTQAELPENQLPSTAAATYVIHDTRKQNIVHTVGGGRIALDDAAVKTLSHQFYNTYHIGFSHVIQELVVCSSKFQYKNVVILDTPGYNKADTGKIQEAKDFKIARQRLRTVDYLIWLVDIENGEVKKKDYDFIGEIDLDQPCLVVFNKADDMPIEKVEAVIGNAAERLADSQLASNLYDVIAYSSKFGKTIIGGDALERFLSEADKYGQTYPNVHDEYIQLGSEMIKDIKKQIEEADGKIKELEGTISEAVDTGRIQSLIEECAQIRGRRYKLQEAERTFGRCFR